MHVQQLYTKCLAQGSYYIHSNGEAAIIDPLREVQQYIDQAEKDGVKIKYIFETHFHADFVSGHVSLSKKTGAPIIYGPLANPNFEAIIAEDGQVFEIGDLKIKVLHTPGHTVESTCYLLKDADDKNHCLFSGDTLFLGDVGRPDLCQKGADITEEDLAGMLFESLRAKIMPLENELIVYPAHGAGSACGKSMMKETVDTLGNQKKVNYALRADMTKAEFIEEVTDGLGVPPSYFPLNVKLNKEGYKDLDVILERGLTSLSPEVFKSTAEKENALILDVRDKDSFRQGHIPGAMFIGLDGSFAPWVGALIKDITKPILLVVPEGRAKEAVTRLSRVGFDNTMGVLEGGISNWESEGYEVSTINQVDTKELRVLLEGDSKLPIFDARKPSEYQSAHPKVSQSAPLSLLDSHLSDFPTDKPFYIHCQSGYRSIVAASILKSKGLHNVVDLAGGYNALVADNFEIEETACSLSS